MGKFTKLKFNVPRKGQLFNGSYKFKAMRWIESAVGGVWKAVGIGKQNETSIYELKVHNCFDNFLGALFHAD